MHILPFKPGVTTSRDVDNFIAGKNPNDLRYGKSGDQHILYVSPGKEGREAFEKMEISLNAVGQSAVTRFRNVINNSPTPAIDQLLQEIEGRGNVRSPGKAVATPRQEHLAQFMRLKNFILKKHLDQPSLFRLDGNRKMVAEIHDAKAGTFQLKGVDLNDLGAHTLATLIKRMVRAFPGGVFGDQAGQASIKKLLKEIGGAPSDTVKQAKLAELGKALAALPEENRQFLGECWALMRAVAAHSASNKMTLENLAPMFEQNLFPNLDVSLEDLNTSVRDASQDLVPKLNAQQWGLVDYLNSLTSGA